MEGKKGRALLERHFVCVSRYFLSKVDRRVADDLAQEAFVCCLENLPRFEERGCFRAFILGIARNRLFKYLRNREREGRAMARHEHATQEQLCTPSGALEVLSEHDLLLRSLGLIPRDLQVLVELYYWDELPLADIACVLEIPVGTVKSRLARARARIKEGVGRDA